MLISSISALVQIPNFTFRNHEQPKNQFLFWNLALPLKRNNGQRSKLKLGTKKLVGKIQSKPSTKWVSYGGSIPSILKSLNAVEDLDEALKPWERSLSSKERTIILKEQTNWKRALQIFDWFKSKGCYEINVIHYNIMLRTLGRARRWDLMKFLWIEMKSSGVTATNSTYGTLIDAYAKGGMQREALVWLGEMYKQGMEPDEVTMGIVVQTCKKARDFRKAEEFFKKWSSVAIDDDSLESRRGCSLYTYNTLIDTYGKAGELKQASDTFARMLREGIAPDVVTFNTMIHVCGNHGFLQEVGALMSLMEEIRCFPDTRTYNILISLYTKSDDINTAAGYFLKMKVDGLVPDIVSYRTLLYAFSIRNMVGEAELLVMEMGEQGLQIDEYTQSALTRMYVRVEMPEKSWSWFERFCDNMSSECFAANIDAFGEKCHINLAEKAFDRCLDRGKVSVLVFNVMIKAYGVCREYGKACDLFDNMKSHGTLPDECTYTSLIQILSSGGLPREAALYLKRMQVMGFINNCIPLSMVITSFSRKGDLQKAEEIFQEMVGLGLKPDIVVYSALINGFTEIGSVAEALSYVKSMKSSGFEPNAIVCNSLIKLYTKIGYLQEAQETYELLKALGDVPDVYSSNCMIDLYSENSMLQNAEEVFWNLKQRGEANEFSHAMMLCLYKKLGHFSKAYEIVQDMKTHGLLTETLSCNNVISLYASDGRMKEAVLNFRQMLASGVQPNDATFRLLGDVLLKRGASVKAIKHLELLRKNNAHSGLHEWVKALCAVVRLEHNLPKFGGTLNGHYESMNLEHCFHG
ncbi:uncharacterized protein A4U43_C08F20310 [Asparagus officinalis]|uniref:pentatricopeptide repeat-containing protein At3g23020 n=1 Tax=Asparagus officinalis TaxID=4686 RepID=UPI00098DF94B|nr:pentatricopeptide repeat-containing protein At3g23020 [Asparagus officinalis]XP_020242129.1 pentatricopeptide repeat-containing protein At3g23020 [Asparagus officinalis]ONK60598.1 uncharacterized protein A4U43_C08F20310 [Asparagus officinalis]